MILFKEVFSSLISLIKRGEATMNSRKQSLNQPENLEVSSSSTARRNAINVDMITFKRKFIEPYRAMEEYFLRPSHLQDLPKTHRRSPYFYEDYILVLNRSDVEER
jgi:zinc transporter 9